MMIAVTFPIFIPAHEAVTIQCGDTKEEDPQQEAAGGMILEAALAACSRAGLM